MQGYKKEYLLDLFDKFVGKHKHLPTRRQMYTEFGIREDPFCRVFGSWNEAKVAYKSEVVSCNQSLVLDTPYDEDYLFDDIIKAEQAQADITDLFKNKTDFKILSLSDIELPYANTDMINHAVDHALSEGTKVCVLNGDVTHSDFFSKHEKSAYIDPREEYSQLEQLCTWLSKKFEKVVLVSGNHDKMVKRFCHRAIPKYESMNFLMNDDLLATVSKKLENVEYSYNWWVKIKDVIYLHPDSFTVLPMRTGIAASGVIRKTGVTASAYILGHTHKVGQYNEGDATFFEQGCSCRPQVYYMGRGGQKWENAYNLTTITNGAFDFNNSRNYLWSE